MRHFVRAFSSYINHPSKTRFDGEDDGEEIILVLRRHFITNLDWIFISLLLITVPLFAGMIFESFGISFQNSIPSPLSFTLTSFWYLFTFGFILENFLIWFYNVYMVTNKKIIDMDFHGVLYRNIAEAPIRNVEDVTHTVSGAAQVIFNYGDVIVQTAAEQREFEFLDVPRPARVQDAISDLVARKRGHA